MSQIWHIGVRATNSLVEDVVQPPAGISKQGGTMGQGSDQGMAGDGGTPMPDEIATGNAEQAEAWNGDDGQYWVQQRERQEARYRRLTPHLGVLSECWVLAGEGHAVGELEERVVHVVSGF
ncbi:hypothetical protein AB0D26_32490, partial [Streptomyces libani]